MIQETFTEALGSHPTPVSGAEDLEMKKQRSALRHETREGWLRAGVSEEHFRGPDTEGGARTLL